MQRISRSLRYTTNSLLLSPPSLSLSLSKLCTTLRFTVMKRGSGHARAWMKGNEDDDYVILDSDSSGISDQCKDFSSTINSNNTKEGLDLNQESNDKAEVCDQQVNVSYSDHEYKVAKGRKVWLNEKTGQHDHSRGSLRGEEEERVQGSGGKEQEGHKLEINSLGLKNMKNYDRRERKKEIGQTLMWEVWKEEHERWVEENMRKDFDLDHLNDVVAETCEAPSDLIMPLPKYQKEWLAWALKQEESNTKGGILADEMGMGKTIQAISLVLAKGEIQRAVDGLIPSCSSSMGRPVINGTLVICPLAAVTQWVREIDRFTTIGSNKVLVYHGANRGKNLHESSGYDFVITTYSIVEAKYRKYVMPPKPKCERYGEFLGPCQIIRHYCQPDQLLEQQTKGLKPGPGMVNQKTESDAGGANKFEGNKRKKAHKKSAGVEIDLPARKSILHSVKWNRIILDEAHYIKDRRSNTTKAVFALESSYKWALSGTPVQNRIGELYSLVRFLQIVPCSYCFCKDCDCRVLDYSTSECPNCSHMFFRHFCWWNKFVAKPIQLQKNVNDVKRAMILLKHKVLQGIVLRRTKKGRAADLALPRKIVSLRRDNFDIREEDYYKSLYNESQARFNTYVESGTVMRNYANIFELLTRLRQAVDHPYLVVYSSTASSGKESMVDGGNDEQVCGLCHEPVEVPVVASCAHIFCKSCLMNYSASVGQVSCPSCSKPVTVDFTGKLDNGDQKTKTTMKGFKSSSILNRIQLDNFQTSTKIEALREEIRFMVERDGSAKGIVFSQFTSFLDLIHYSLEKSGITCIQLVGSMSMDARNAAVSRFSEDPDCKIFLMSLKAGGIALNLTVASHVFMMDPWWNPALERQAQDRIHRIGQYKPSRIVRFIIKNTVEERILKLQEKKELALEGTIGASSSEALGKLTEGDLKFLFQV